MIKINLLAERKQAKARSSTSSLQIEGGGGGRNLLLAAILILGLVVAGGWWWMARAELADWERKHEEADRELERLAEIRKQGEEYKAQKELLERKVNLITELKKRQEVPVHILDQISKNLPDFLWLESLSAKQSRVSISGKATNYNAVSNFYENLSGSGLFGDVNLGRVFEVPEGVAFSLTCNFTGLGGAEPENKQQQPRAS
jgi:Tfp pilus assembly protein PilN